MYGKFAIQVFKNVSSFIFEYDGKISICISLYGNYFDFIIKILTLDEFFKDFFFINPSENAIWIFIDEIERIIVKIKECLIE